MGSLVQEQLTSNANNSISINNQCQDPDSSSFEGIWKDEFYIQKVTMEDYQNIIKHLRETYYREETCHKVLGWCETKAQDLDLVVYHILTHGLSLVAFNKHSNKVAGVRIVIDQRKKLDFTKLNLQSPHIPTILIAKNKLVEDERRLINEHYSSSTKAATEEVEEEEIIATAFITSVEPKYRGIHLASEMHARSLIQLRSNGFTMIKSFFSSLITRKIALQLGYKEIAHLYLGDLKDEQGKLYFPNVTPPPDYWIGYMGLKL